MFLSCYLGYWALYCMNLVSSTNLIPCWSHLQKSQIFESANKKMVGKSTRKVNQSNILCFMLFFDFFSSAVLDSTVWSFFVSLLLFSEHETVGFVPSFLAASDCKDSNYSLWNGGQRSLSMFYLIGFELEKRLTLVLGIIIFFVPILCHSYVIT